VTIQETFYEIINIVSFDLSPLMMGTGLLTPWGAKRKAQRIPEKGEVKFLKIQQ
jgi:hypothetical protein